MKRYTDSRQILITFHNAMFTGKEIQMGEDREAEVYEFFHRPFIETLPTETVI